MRQVPRYLIIGRGRLARHIEHYFCLIGHACSTWHRDLSLANLYQKISQVSHILILINDDAIQSFIDAHLSHVSHAYLIHCSGRLTSDTAIGVHPLMTFGQTLYSLDKYRNIPFVIEEGAPSFSLLFPEFVNPIFFIPKALKEKYHALCALSGNLTCYLWQEVILRFQREFAFPKEVLLPYLTQQTDNLINDFATALTGPLARGDQKTIKAHLNVLQQDHLQSIYQGFIDSFAKRIEVSVQEIPSDDITK